MERARTFEGMLHSWCLFTEITNAAFPPNDRAGKVGREEGRPMPSRDEQMIQHDLNKTLFNTG